MASGNPFTVRLPAELKRELDDFVKLTGQSRSAFVREALAAYVPKLSEVGQAESDSPKHP